MLVSTGRPGYSRIGGELRDGHAVLIIRYDYILTTHLSLITVHGSVFENRVSKNLPGCGATCVVKLNCGKEIFV